MLRSPKMVGYLAYLIGRVLLKTLRVECVFHPDFDLKQQYVYGFWHDKQFSPIMLLTKIGRLKKIALVSASQDGQIIATWLKCLGYDAIRGSSSRHGIASMVRLIAKAKKGYDVVIAADGPRGPRHRAKLGVGFIADKAKLAIVPLGVAYSKKWVFLKAWDRYQLPCPFSKVIFYFGAPLPAPKEKLKSNTLTYAINVAERVAVRRLRNLDGS